MKRNIPDWQLRWEEMRKNPPTPEPWMEEYVEATLAHWKRTAEITKDLWK